jgi:hypothetical protein
MTDFLKQPNSTTEQIPMNAKFSIKANRNNICSSLTKAAGLALILGSLFLNGQVKAAPINHAAVGYLKVFSSTQESQWGEGSYYYLRTSYRIFDSNGKAVKMVENHSGSTDEDPQKVELAPGRYVVWAQSDRKGLVKVAVSIKPGQLAAVHLEKDNDNYKEFVTPAAGMKSVCCN